MSAREIAVEAAKGAPPVSVGATMICGYPLSEVVLLATLTYTLLLGLHTGLKVYYMIKNKGKASEGQ